MNSKLMLFILLSAVLSSCKKTTNVDVTVSTSGKLTYKLLDDSGKGMPRVKVSLFDNNPSYYSNASILLDTRVTDENGLVDFGDLNPSNYRVYPDSPVVNNVKYNFFEHVQVITGATKHKEAKVTDYSGTFKIKLQNTNSQAQKGIGVLLVPAQKFIYSSTVTNLIALADYKGLSDDAGMVTLKVPSDKAYTTLIYNTTTNTPYGWSNHNTVERDKTISMSFFIYPN